MTIFLRFPDEPTAQTVLADYYSAEFGWNKASLVHAHRSGERAALHEPLL